jgi:hypothetical protein
MAEDHPQAAPTTPEQPKSAPVEGKPMEQPSKTAPQSTPETTA